MKKYPKNRKSSGYAICGLCGKRFVARGLGTHKREAHKMVIRKVDFYSNKTPFTTVNDKPINTVNINPIDENKKRLNYGRPYDTLPTEVNSDKTFTDKGLVCNQAQKACLYSEIDLWILYGRISVVFYSSFYPPHIMKSRLIKDFEDRFKCNFDNVKKANPHICPEKEFAKNHDLKFKFAGMKYSR
jgi:hypothetical protein